MYPNLQYRFSSCYSARFTLCPENVAGYAPLFQVPPGRRIHDRYGPRGLQVVGVSVDTAGDREKVRNFLAREGVSYRTLLDPQDRAAQAFGLPMLPGSFLFNRDGYLQQHDRYNLLRSWNRCPTSTRFS